MKSVVGILAAGALAEFCFLLIVRLGDLRANTAAFLALYFPLFAIALFCFLAFPRLEGRALRAVLLFALLFRLTMLASPPTLSNDIYRYIWDGRLLSDGINPYLYAPEDPALAAYRSEIYGRMNYPDTHTVYPPTSQFLFLFAYQVAGENPLMLKAVFGGLDFMACILMARLLAEFGLPLGGLFLYAWNPLPIVEFAGSGHSDSGMLFFLLLSFYLLKKGWSGLSMAGLGFAICSKVFPLLYIPFYLRLVPLKRLLATALVVASLCAPLYKPEAVANVRRSLEKYYRLFEFNASIHYLARYIGREYYGVSLNKKNGPVLRAVFFALAVLLFVFFKVRSALDLMRAIFYLMIMFLLLSTTMHPWYVAWALVFVPFFPKASIVYLSGAVALSYLTYTSNPWMERSWVLLLEYLPTYGLLAYELRGGRAWAAEPGRL